MTRAVEEEAKETGVHEVVGRPIGEALDSVVQAAVHDSQFPETSYESLHSYCGGIDLLIGIKCNSYYVHSIT